VATAQAMFAGVNRNRWCRPRPAAEGRQRLWVVSQTSLSPH
jgi:hypothetical protein